MINNGSSTFKLPRRYFYKSHRNYDLQWEKKKNTKHKVCYSCWHSSYLLFFKLAHGVDYLECNKIFAIGKPFMNMVLHEFVSSVNIVFKDQICWP